MHLSYITIITILVGFIIYTKYKQIMKSRRLQYPRSTSPIIRAVVNAVYLPYKSIKLWNLKDDEWYEWIDIPHGIMNIKSRLPVNIGAILLVKHTRKSNFAVRLLVRNVVKVKDYQSIIIETLGIMQYEEK